VAFVFTVWQALDTASPVPRRFYRAALAFLVVAGAGAMLPGVVMAKGITDPWILQITLQAFLTPFVSGWLMLGAAGAVYHRFVTGRFGPWVFWLTCAGTLPSAFLHTTAAPPAEWIVWVGRGGVLLLGVAALLFAADVLRGARGGALVRIAGAAVALKGVAEIAVAAGPGLALLSIRSLTIAYLHLVLLALVTPVLMAAALGIEQARIRATSFGGGLALMLAALVVLGWPDALNRLGSAGVGAGDLLWAALAGAALAAGAAMAMLCRPYRAPASAQQAEECGILLTSGLVTSLSSVPAARPYRQVGTKQALNPRSHLSR
jgi:hypothetical protein